MTREELLAADTVAIDALWTNLLELHSDYNRVSREHHYAAAHLPWWAAPGPSYLVADGEPEDTVNTCGHPAIQGMKRPTMRGVKRLIRPGPHTFDDRRQHDALVLGIDRAEHLYAERMDGYRLRCAAQEEERTQLGLPALEDRQDAIQNEINAAFDALEALQPSIERAAALTLYEIVLQAGREETLEKGAGLEGLAALRGLRPFLRGAVADTVADFLDNPRRPMGHCPLWGGYWPGN